MIAGRRKEGRFGQDFVGMVLARRREDDEALSTLRPPPGTPVRPFIVEALGTITLLVDRVAAAIGESPQAVLEHLHSAGSGTALVDVAEAATAALAGDAEDMHAVADRATDMATFIPALMHTADWLAEQLAIASGTTAETVLQDLALSIAAGESGAFDADG